MFFFQKSPKAAGRQSVNQHFPRGMIMIIVISQSKLLQPAGLWIWHTSYGSATPAFHKNFEVVICHSVQQQRDSRFSFLHHNCCCPFIKHDQQKQCLRK